MKKLLLFSLVIGIIASCSQEQQEPNLGSQDAVSFLKKAKGIDPQEAENEMRNWLAANTARLSTAIHLKKECDSNIRVPSDYPTIQEAVDHVCDGGIVLVDPGMYEEVVMVDKPGVHIKANGDVTLMGGFNLSPNAGETRIQGFTIEIHDSFRFGVNAFDADGIEVTHNTIVFVSNFNSTTGIRFFDSNESKVHKNHVEGTSWGIFFGSSTLEGASSNLNVISNNYLTGITFASVIGLQGNCDENFIHDNVSENNLNTLNADIMLYSGAPYAESTCDYNIIRNNSSRMGFIGAWIFNAGTMNEIGAGNEFLDHSQIGIHISGIGATGNVIKENTALGNANCDIVNNADDITANTFLDNIADCTVNL